MQEVTRILAAIEEGDSRGSEQLLPLVYDELRRLAAHRLSQEKPGQTLSATALVHEAYVRLVGDKEARWDSQGHFFAAAARAMRHILIERARSRRREKRGGGAIRLDINVNTLALDSVPDQILDLDEALIRLAEEDRVKAELVELRYFAGMSLKEAAAVLGISIATADRYWAYARAWLYDALRCDQEP